MALLTSLENIIINKKTFINDSEELSVDILSSYLDDFNNINNRKGYNFDGIPRNYYELVKLANSKGLHVALAVNKNANKYACGISKTKAGACDIALVRCKTFIPLEEFDKLFKNQKSNLLDELKRRKSIYPVKSLLGNIVDSEVNISADKKLLTYRYLNDDDKSKHKNLLEKYLNNMDEISLAVMYYRIL